MHILASGWEFCPRKQWEVHRQNSCIRFQYLVVWLLFMLFFFCVFQFKFIYKHRNRFIYNFDPYQSLYRFVTVACFNANIYIFGSPWIMTTYKSQKFPIYVNTFSVLSIFQNTGEFLLIGRILKKSYTITWGGTAGKGKEHTCISYKTWLEFKLLQ